MAEAISTTGCEKGKDILDLHMGTERSFQKSRMGKKHENRAAMS